MSYLYSLENICNNLTIGYKINHINKGEFIIKSLPVGDNKLIELANKFEQKKYSLKVLYNNNLIKYDMDLFKTKEINNIANNTLIEEKELEKKIIITNYSELKKFFFTNSTLPNEFFHFTHSSNAIRILQTGFIKSRYSTFGTIPYDNMIKNETTQSVMSSNQSNKIEKYVRFYFNPRNKTTYSMKKNIKENNGFPVLIAIDYSSIWKAKTYVYVTPKSAHYINDYDLYWINGHNINNVKNLHNINFREFDFKKTFFEYSVEENNKNQMAEILFFDKITTDFITHIYFACKHDLEMFISKLSYDLKQKYANKCLINEYLLWEK